MTEHQETHFRVRRDGQLYVFQHGFWEIVEGFYFRPFSMACALKSCNGKLDKHPNLGAVIYPLIGQR
jgi:hypothetical protein